MRSTSTNQTRSLIRQAVTLLACFAWLALAGERAEAAWSNASGGNYTNAANWGGTVPGPNDVASFNLDASYPVALTANVITNSGLEFNGNIETVNLNLNSNTLVLVSAGSAFGQSTIRSAVQTNTVVISNGTILMPNNTATYISASYLVSANTIATLTFSNMTFNANVFGVDYDFNQNHAGVATWTLYNSTVTLGKLVLAGTGGRDDIICTGNILVGGGSTLTVTNEIVVGSYGIPTGNITVVLPAFPWDFPLSFRKLAA